MVIPSAVSKVTLNRDGSLYADNNFVGKIRLVTFDNPQMLEREDSGLYKEIDSFVSNAKPVEDAEILQGMVEQSNVQAVVEMTRMMQVARSYESTQKIVDKEDDRIRQTIRRISQVQ